MDREFLEKNGVDVEKGLELLGDMDMYNETMEDYLKEVTEKFKKLKEFKEKEDMENYSIVVHSIKSDSKYHNILHAPPKQTKKREILLPPVSTFAFI